MTTHDIIEALKAMPIADLDLIRAKAAEEIVTAKADNFESCKQHIASLMANHLRICENYAASEGFTLRELLPAKVKPAAVAEQKSSTPVKAKPMFANPANLTQTWTGRGRCPAWIKNTPKDQRAQYRIAA